MERHAAPVIGTCSSLHAVPGSRRPRHDVLPTCGTVARPALSVKGAAASRATTMFVQVQPASKAIPIRIVGRYSTAGTESPVTR